MDWNDLRFFLAAHRSGSLSGAARDLKVVRVSSLLAGLNAAIGGLGIASLPCLVGDSEPALERVTY